MLAVNNGHDSIMCKLLDSGANINHRNKVDSNNNSVSVLYIDGPRSFVGESHCVVVELSKWLRVLC